MLSSTLSAVPVMLANFKKRYLDPRSPHHEEQPFLERSDSQMSNWVPQHHQDVAIDETVCEEGCTCQCAMRDYDDAEGDVLRKPTTLTSQSRGHTCNSLPTTRSIIQMLYPPSYLDLPFPFPDPPSYHLNDSSRGDDPELSPLISPTITSGGGALLQCRPIDPLSQDSSFTGVPSSRTPFRMVMLIEPNPPIAGLGEDVPEGAEPLPVYSSFDQRRPRFPTASDVLGPYPPLSVVRQAVKRN